MSGAQHGDEMPNPQSDAWVQASGSQNQSVNVSQNVSQAPQQQGNGGLPMGPQGMTVTHHHYHLLNHAGGPEVMAAMGVAGADQVGFLASNVFNNMPESTDVFRKR